MRIRLALTLDVHRDPPAESFRDREAQMDALVDRADPYPIGFQADPGRVERPAWDQAP